ncbi:MAG: hypothetical protein ACPLN0_03215 [Candidatus Hydrothermia bacterium]
MIKIFILIFYENPDGSFEYYFYRVLKRDPFWTPNILPAMLHLEVIRSYLFKPIGIFTMYMVMTTVIILLLVV